MHNDRTAILCQLLRVVFGLFLCSTGVYLIIQANLGLSPWEGAGGQFSFLLLLFCLLSLAAAALVAVVNRKRFKK